MDFEGARWLPVTTDRAADRHDAPSWSVGCRCALDHGGPGSEHRARGTAWGSGEHAGIGVPGDGGPAVTSAAVWQEVGERVFRRRYPALDLNVGAVLGGDEVLVIDTRSWRAEAEELLRELRALTSLPCRQVLNTHAHFDHCFGNAVFRPAAVWGHQRCAENLRLHGEEPWRRRRSRPDREAGGRAARRGRPLPPCSGGRTGVTGRRPARAISGRYRSNGPGARSRNESPY